MIYATKIFLVNLLVVILQMTNQERLCCILLLSVVKGWSYVMVHYVPQRPPPLSSGKKPGFQLNKCWGESIFLGTRGNEKGGVSSYSLLNRGKQLCPNFSSGTCSLAIICCQSFNSTHHPCSITLVLTFHPVLHVIFDPLTSAYCCIVLSKLPQLIFCNLIFFLNKATIGHCSAHALLKT